MLSGKLETARDPTLQALYDNAGGAAPSDGALRGLLDEWSSWGRFDPEWPGKVHALPGIGRAVPGEKEYHPFVGEERQKVVQEEAAGDGWADALLAHSRHAFSRQLTATGRLEALKAGDLGAAQAALWPDPAMVERRLDASPHVRKAIRIVSEAEREPRGSQAAPRGEAEPQRPLEQPASRDEGAVRKELKEEPADAPEPAPQASTPPASQSTSQAPPPSEAVASAEM